MQTGFFSNLSPSQFWDKVRGNRNPFYPNASMFHQERIIEATKKDFVDFALLICHQYSFTNTTSEEKIREDIEMLFNEYFQFKM